MIINPPALAYLSFHWGYAYLPGYARDRWVAVRRDGKRFLAADTLAGLERAINDDTASVPYPAILPRPGRPDIPVSLTGNQTMTWIPWTRKCFLPPSCGKRSRYGPSATHRNWGPGSPGRAARPSGKAPFFCCGSLNADRAKEWLTRNRNRRGRDGL